MKRAVIIKVDPMSRTLEKNYK